MKRAGATGKKNPSFVLQQLLYSLNPLPFSLYTRIAKELLPSLKISSVDSSSLAQWEGKSPFE